jgi:hypothetical protein
LGASRKRRNYHHGHALHEIAGIKNGVKTIKDLRDFETILKYCAGKKARFRFYREF